MLLAKLSVAFSSGSNRVKKQNNALGWLIEHNTNIWFVYLNRFKLYAHTIVASHTGSRGWLIIVVYLKQFKFYKDQTFWNLCQDMFVYRIHTEIFSKLN